MVFFSVFERKIVSRMTYNVLTGMLNSAITITFFTKLCHMLQRLVICSLKLFLLVCLVFTKVLCIISSSC